MDSPDRDSRDVKRGKCNKCSKCDGYRRRVKGGGNGASNSCQLCGCVPGKHVKIVAASTKSAADTGDIPNKEQVLCVSSEGEQMARDFGSLRLLKGNSASDDFTDHCIIARWSVCKCCSNNVDFDINTGKECEYCEHHRANPPGAVVVPTIPTVPSISASPAQIPTSVNGQASPGMCAIEECTNPRHVDPNGKEHECCGYTHAMELIRRRIIEGPKQNIVKGVTHCLLPTCNKITWPFMNYCGKTHADQGKKLGLKSIPQASSGRSSSLPKDLFLCQLPGCNNRRRPKSADGSSFHPFCGKSHANEAKKKGITPPGDEASGPKTSSMCMLEECCKPKRMKSDGKSFHDYCSLEHAEAAASNAMSASVTKDDNICIIPECSRLKFVDPKTKTVTDYCSKGHVAEGLKRGIQPILTSRSEVDKFLKNFSSTLNVLNIKENDRAKTGGVLYKKFIKARDSLPMASRKTRLAFHGTADQNIDSICANGYDPSKRSGQAHGPGEYFATSPSTPMSYCKGGKRLLLNELLLGQSGTHHTQHGDVVVMKCPEHDLPRFVITFS